MTATQPALDGMPAPLAEDWVLRKACGCPIGVAVAGRYHPTEDAAWKGFYDGWKAIAKALQRGEQLELMPHSRYRADVLPHMSVSCEHEETQ